MKKTKVRINISENIKNKIRNIKEKSVRVLDKIKANLKENKGKSLTKQSVKYYTLLSLMIMVAIISTYANIREYKKINKEEYITYSLNETEVEANSSSVISEERAEENNIEEMNQEGDKEQTEVIYKTAISSISTNVESVENLNKNFPVNGKIVQEYSQDDVIYYPSLGVWKTHGGVDIECSTGEQVKCVVDGKIVGVYQDDVFGNSVVIETNEYTCVYSSLEQNISVRIGEYIKKGDIIGTAGKNVAEANHGVHLHFELMKDGEYINPSLIGIK